MLKKIAFGILAVPALGGIGFLSLALGVAYRNAVPIYAKPTKPTHKVGD